MNCLFDSQYTDQNMALHVLSYLDSKGLNNIRALNKIGQQLVDNNKLYQWPDDGIKERFQEELSNILEQPTASSQQSWASYIATKIYCLEGILSVITKIFCFFFPVINKEVQKQKRHDEALLWTNYLKKLAANSPARREAFEKIASLFGGQKGWEKIPATEGYWSNLPVFNPEKIRQLAHPISKGQCYDLTEFAILRLQHIASEKYVHLFIQELNPINGMEWACTSAPLSGSFHFRIINKEGAFIEDNFSKLQQWIQNAGTGNYCLA